MACMALFKWSPLLQLGIPEVDADHQRLFSLADELHVAVSQAAAPREIQDRLASLIDHSRAHFAREEEFMARCNYPGRATHTAEHEQLTARALHLQREFIVNGRALSSEILRSLHEWLVSHIDTADRSLSGFAQADCRLVLPEEVAKG